MYSVFIVKMYLRKFHWKVDIFFAKRVIATHMSLKHLKPVTLSFLSLLRATGYVRHNIVAQKTKIQFSRMQKLGFWEQIYSCSERMG